MENTPKHFALQLGSLASLYLSLIFIVVLIFNIINLSFPDPAESYWQTTSAIESVRLAFAMVVVFFPTYLILTRLVNKTRRANQSGNYLFLTKWLIYLSLLVAGGVLLGDLVAIILAFLNGELTTRFILKALALVVVVGAAFGYYLLDAREYWITNERQSVWYGAVVSLVVVGLLITALTYIDSPAEVRERNLDEKQLTDLQDISWRIYEHYHREGSFPEGYRELYIGSPAPAAPEDRPSYRYEVSEDGFVLCATFTFDSTYSPNTGNMRPYPVDAEKELFSDMYNWEHPAGEYCFERILRTE